MKKVKYTPERVYLNNDEYLQDERFRLVQYQQTRSCNHAIPFNNAIRVGNLVAQFNLLMYTFDARFYECHYLFSSVENHGFTGMWKIE